MSSQEVSQKSSQEPKQNNTDVLNMLVNTAQNVLEFSDNEMFKDRLIWSCGPDINPQLLESIIKYKKSILEMIELPCEFTLKEIGKYFVDISGYPEPIYMKPHTKKPEHLHLQIAIILIYVTSSKGIKYFISMEKFIKDYYEIVSKCPIDYDFLSLLLFRNVLGIANNLIRANNNKDKLLQIVSGCVDGFKVKRITGSGATIHTRVRMEIIIKDNNLEIKPRPPRKRKIDEIT